MEEKYRTHLVWDKGKKETNITAIQYNFEYFPVCDCSICKRHPLSYCHSRGLAVTLIGYMLFRFYLKLHYINESRSTIFPYVSRTLILPGTVYRQRGI